MEKSNSEALGQQLRQLNGAEIYICFLMIGNMLGIHFVPNRQSFSPFPLCQDF